MLTEYRIPAKEMVPFIIKPEHRHLVADYLEILTPDNRLSLRRYFVHQMMLHSGYTSRNAVLVLHGLAFKGDPAAIALFTPDEYAAPLKVPYDYDGGRRLLVALGLLSKECQQLQRSMPPSKRVLAMTLNDIRERGEADARLIGLDDANKTNSEARSLAMATRPFLSSAPVIPLAPSWPPRPRLTSGRSSPPAVNVCHWHID